MLRVGAESHDTFDAGAVVPGAVEEHDLAAGREVLDVALEVPAGGLALGWLLQGDGAGTTGVEMLVEALDGATLTGGVATLEEDDVLLAGVLGPVLPLQQLDLEGALDVLVLIAAHALFVGVVLAPGVDALAVWGDQYRVVFIGVIHHVPLGGCEVDEVHVFFVGVAHALHLFFGLVSETSTPSILLLNRCGGGSRLPLKCIKNRSSRWLARAVRGAVD